MTISKLWLSVLAILVLAVAISMYAVRGGPGVLAVAIMVSAVLVGWKILLYVVYQITYAIVSAIKKGRTS